MIDDYYYSGQYAEEQAEAETQAKEATPHEQLLAELLNPNAPKTEREHAAVNEIERLRRRKKCQTP